MRSTQQVRGQLLCRVRSTLAIVTEVVEVEQDTIVITDTPDQPTQVISGDSGDLQATQAIAMPGESESKS